MKKAQGISITTIIVAAIALIVLVVLIAIFTGRISLFERTIAEEGSKELAVLKVEYGQCKPSLEAERNFLDKYNAAQTEDAKRVIRSDYEKLIGACKSRGASGAEACQGVTLSGIALSDMVNWQIQNICTWQG